MSVTFSISLWRQTGRKKPVSRLDLEGRESGEEGCGGVIVGKQEGSGGGAVV